MRILIISSTQSGIGGIPHHIQGLTKFLSKTNHHVEIISSDNTPIIPIRGLKNPSFMITSFIKTKFTKKYDIVHAHDLPSALSLRNISGKKILTFHGIFSKQIKLTHGKIATKISEKYENKAIKWADAITAISKESFEFYKNKKSNIYHIPNGIDIESLEKKIDRRFDNQIIFAGRLSNEKGIPTLLEIARNLPKKYNLIIVGSGPEEKKVKEISKTLDNIHYLGLKEKNQTISLIRGSDVLIQPSYVEGISSTILEAIACKIPIIASNLGGNLELLEDQKTGILIDPKNPELIIENISKLLTDTQLSNFISENAFHSVKKYDWNVIGNKYLEIYQSLLN